MTSGVRGLAARLVPRRVRGGTPVAGGVAAKLAEGATLVALATVVPRVLGPVVYGRFSVVLTVVMIGTTALALGGTPLLSRYVPAAPPGRRSALARALGLRLAAGRAAQLTGIVVLSVLLTVVAPGSFPPWPTLAAAAALAGNAVATLALQVGLGLGRTGPWNARYPLQNAVLVAGVVVLYPLAGPRGALLAIVGAAVCALGVGAVAVRGVLRASGPAPALPDGALRFGRQQGVGWALLQFAQRGGVLAVALLAGSAAETGFAALAIGVALPGVYAVLRLFTVSLPGLAEHVDGPAGGAGDGGPDPAAVAAAEGRLRRLAGGVLAALVPGVAGAAVVLDRAVPFVFGAGFVGAVDAFVPALAVVVLGPVTALLIQSAALRLRPDATLWSALAGAGAFVVASLVAVPRWGAVGGTAATLVGMVVTVIVAARLLSGAVGWRLGAATGAGAAAVTALAAVV